jgi:hypothetical protein
MPGVKSGNQRCSGGLSGMSTTSHASVKTQLLLINVVVNGEVSFFLLIQKILSILKRGGTLSILSS